MPGWSIGHKRYERPWCEFDSGSVRHTTKHQSARCASVVHTFWPVITHSSPSSTARLDVGEVGAGVGLGEALAPQLVDRLDLREEAALLLVGAELDERGREQALAEERDPRRRVRRAYSSLKITCWANASARPPYSSGHDMPTQRSAPSTRSHSIRTSQPVSSAGPPAEPSAANSPVRCSASQARTSARKAASSGVSRKSMPGRTLLDRPVRFPGTLARVPRRSAATREVEQPELERPSSRAPARPGARTHRWPGSASASGEGLPPHRPARDRASRRRRSRGRGPRRAGACRRSGNRGAESRACRTRVVHAGRARRAPGRPPPALRRCARNTDRIVADQVGADQRDRLVSGRARAAAARS